MSESDMIAGLKSGSERAFEAIYECYARRLMAFCAQYCKTIEDAEEIVEDVFVKLWQQRESIRQKETLKSLLFIMSKHQVINAYRRTINSPIFAEYVDYCDDLKDTSSISMLEYDDFVRQMNKVLLSLPRTQQNVIRLSRIEGYGNKSIAEQLGLSEQTVKNQLSIGLKAMRASLKKTFSLIWWLFLLN